MSAPHRHMDEAHWRDLEQACHLVLGIATTHREELATIMRTSGSHYRPGSFVAALFDLMEIAEKRHKQLHREAAKREVEGT
jgi:hypothetical protein